MDGFPPPCVLESSEVQLKRDGWPEAVSPGSPCLVREEEPILPLIRRLLSNVNQRTALGTQEMLTFTELSAFTRAVASDATKESAKAVHLQRQLSTALHQHFRRRWPLSLPDWSPQEVARGLDRPTGNRALGSHLVDASAMGVPYINAAIVPGLPPSPLSYIATQHPLPSTVGDFWRMVLLLRPAAIVMLNGAPAAPHDGDLPEYWRPECCPGDDGLSLAVAEADVRDAPSDCVVRTLRCEWRGSAWHGPQLAVAWWRDQSEPPMDRFLALARLLDRLVSEHGPRPPPVVVHCAAGIGRAGVFIAAECGARAAVMGGDTVGCSPDRLVGHLRQCRMNMVQTAEQYEFLHRVLPALVGQLKADRLPLAAGEVDAHAGGNRGEKPHRDAPN